MLLINSSLNVAVSRGLLMLEALQRNSPFQPHPSASHCSRPRGAVYVSPALQCWETGVKTRRPVPKGTPQHLHAKQTCMPHSSNTLQLQQREPREKSRLHSAQILYPPSPTISFAEKQLPGITQKLQPAGFTGTNVPMSARILAR